MKALSKALVIELSLMKDYAKTILIFYVMANSLGVAYKSPAFAISYIMVIIAILGSSPFLLEEKAEMERFYSMIPITAAARVISRYLTFLILGIIGLILAAATQMILFALLAHPISGQEVFLSGLAGIFILVLFISIQFPCYYQWGGTKGRLASMIPAAFMILLPIAVSKSGAGMARFSQLLYLLLRHSKITSLVLLALSSATLAASLFISLHIIRKKGN